MEELINRHKKEQKELQGRIISKKKNATKKTKKGIVDECNRLETELKERQDAEIAGLAPSTLEDRTAQLELEYSTVESHQLTEQPDQGQTPHLETKGEDGKKPNRQKARLARRAAEQQAQIDAAAEEAANMPDKRDIEMSAMKEQISIRGLSEAMIRPDGHCLYSACALTVGSGDYKSIRSATAEFIRGHPDDFEPFMEEPLDSYTNKIKNTAEWGGHLELQAIAKSYKININVLHANGRVDKISGGDKEIWLAYYEHSFGLGEHYNALT